MIFEGNLIANGLRMAIVVSRFNSFITNNLLTGTLSGLKQHGADDADIAWVSGAFEIPLVAKKLAQSKKYQAIIALAAVIRGATSHYDYVCNEVAKGVAQVSLQEELPVIFGVLTTDTIEQAIERSGCKAGNKGYEAAVSAIEMVNVLKTIAAGA